LYGSDAVAGVVNIILNRQYDGVETRARLGTATEGGGFQQTYGALAGKSGENAYAMLNFEYDRQAAIKASQREFTSSAFPDTSLLQAQRRYSVFGSAGWDITPSISASIDALYSNRSADSVISYQGVPQSTNFKSPSYNITGSLNASLFSDWKLAGTAGYGKSLNYSTLTYLTQNRPDSKYHYRNTISFLEMTADGTLFKTAAGAIKAAVGTGYRKEHFDNSIDIGGSRNVKYLYGEITAPIVLPATDRVGLEELDVNIAARSEDYSGFGTTTNPKVGVRYKPLNSLTLRATWGKSFKAPKMFEQYQPLTVSLVNASLFGGTTGTAALYATGGNANLKPERASSWTVGAEFSPDSDPSLHLSITYYAIHFTDRVVRPISTLPGALMNPDYAPFILRNPSPTEQQSLIDDAFTFNNYTGGPYDPGAVSAVLYGRVTNATSQDVTGVDVAYRQTFDVSFGRVEPFANASWLSLKQKTIPALPASTLTGLVGNAPKFKARAGVTFEHGKLMITGAANYLSGLEDAGLTPPETVSSWTTVDLNIAYRVDGRSILTKDLRIALSLTNALNTAPPYVKSTSLFYPGLAYDSSNHSAVGRFIGFSISKGW
jgi:outer membrane receptor protein involved in Fe transport